MANKTKQMAFYPSTRVRNYIESMPPGIRSFKINEMLEQSIGVAPDAHPCRFDDFFEWLSTREDAPQAFRDLIAAFYKQQQGKDDE